MGISMLGPDQTGPLRSSTSRALSGPSISLFAAKKSSVTAHRPDMAI